MNNQTPPENIIQILNQFVANELFESAEALIKKYGLKIKIKDGQLIDESNTTEAWLRKFITVHPLMMAMKDKVRRLATINDEVLITGETGTGKELIARALHGEREGRFIAINCAGIPEHLLESLLFGYVPGAFTGAHPKGKIGAMINASNGTLFLDELGELPLLMQAKLLRAIQEKVISRVGSDNEEEISCRIIAATNRNLHELSYQNNFRIDLYARISTFEIHLLPLFQRKEDIPVILKSLGADDSLIRILIVYFGDEGPIFNVRSLQSVVKRYKTLGEI